ncbi:hypothetical protein GCM10010207_78970 [Streptomyces atratus]|nr:hypothetical protein GCM10010207_78970 [Streptomyces atratus]
MEPSFTHARDRAGRCGPGAQYKARTGSVTVPRGHGETVVIDGEEHDVKLRVFLSNTKARRGKITVDKFWALAALGLDWA